MIGVDALPPDPNRTPHSVPSLGFPIPSLFSPNFLPYHHLPLDRCRRPLDISVILSPLSARTVPQWALLVSPPLETRTTCLSRTWTYQHIRVPLILAGLLPPLTTACFFPSSQVHPW